MVGVFHALIARASQPGTWFPQSISAARVATASAGELTLTSPLGGILAVLAFERYLAPYLGFLSPAGGHDHAGHTHDHDHDHEHGEHCDHPSHAHGHGHGHHTDEISAFAFKSDRAFDSAKLDEFLGGLVNVYGPRMLRYKGVLWMQGAERKVVFQGVHQLMGSDLGAKWGENDARGSKMVFIGKNLPKDIFIRGLEQCLV